MTGSNGPLHVATKEDWSTHRGVLTDYLAPFEDMESVDFALLNATGGTTRSTKKS